MKFSELVLLQERTERYSDLYPYISREYDKFLGKIFYKMFTVLSSVEDHFYITIPQVHLPTRNKRERTIMVKMEYTEDKTAGGATSYDYDRPTDTIFGIDHIIVSHYNKEIHRLLRSEVQDILDVVKIFGYFWENKEFFMDTIVHEVVHVIDYCEGRLFKMPEYAKEYHDTGVLNFHKYANDMFEINAKFYESVNKIKPSKYKNFKDFFKAIMDFIGDYHSGHFTTNSRKRLYKRIYEYWDRNK